MYLIILMRHFHAVFHPRATNKNASKAHFLAARHHQRSPQAAESMRIVQSKYFFIYCVMIFRLQKYKKIIKSQATNR